MNLFIILTTLMVIINAIFFIRYFVLIDNNRPIRQVANKYFAIYSRYVNKALKSKLQFAQNYNRFFNKSNKNHYQLKSQLDDPVKVIIKTNASLDSYVCRHLPISIIDVVNRLVNLAKDIFMLSFLEILGCLLLFNVHQYQMYIKIGLIITLLLNVFALNYCYYYIKKQIINTNNLLNLQFNVNFFTLPEVNDLLVAITNYLAIKNDNADLKELNDKLFQIKLMLFQIINLTNQTALISYDYHNYNGLNAVNIFKIGLNKYEDEVITLVRAIKDRHLINDLQKLKTSSKRKELLTVLNTNANHILTYLNTYFKDSLKDYADMEEHIKNLENNNTQTNNESRINYYLQFNKAGKMLKDGDVK